MSLIGSLRSRVTPDQVRAALSRRSTDSTQRNLERSLPAVRARCERSLSQFVREAWHVLEPATPFVMNWHIEAICLHLELVSSGQITRLLINIPPGPVRADSLVETRFGPRLIRDLRVGDWVMTHLGRYRRVEGVHWQGVLPILRIITNSGRVTHAAPTHPYLTPWGWVAAGDLRRGDRLAVIAPRQERVGADSVTGEEARLLGYMVGDGSLTQGTPVFVNSDPEVQEDFIRCCAAVGFETRSSDRGKMRLIRILGGKLVREFFERHGQQGKSAYHKRIPPLVFSASQEILKEFIGAYWSCDGAIYVRALRKRNSVYRAFATTVSEGLAEDLVYALQIIGIEARLRQKRRPLVTKAQPGGIYFSYSIEVQNEAMTAKFAELMSLCPRKRKLAAQCRRDFDQPIWSDEILDIAIDHNAECMCLTVEEDHSFLINGLAVKNSMKSLLVSSFWPAWEWGPRSMTATRYLTTSFAEIAVGRDCRRMRDLILSDWYQRLWPDVEMRRVGEFSFENTMTGSRDGVPFGSLTSKRADRLIIDDPHSVFKAESKAEREAAVRKFREGAINRLNDQARSAIVVVMQRLHSGDIAGEILEGMGYVSLVLPMEYETGRHCATEYGFSDPRTEEGELLCPKRWSHAVIDDLKRDMGPVGYAAQYQQRPVPRGGGILPYNGWEYWHKAVAMIYGRSENQFPDFDYVLGVLDTAYNEKQENDYSAFVVLGCWYNLYGQPQVMAVHAWRQRLKFHDLVQEVIKWAEKKHCERVLVENKAAGISVFQEIVRLTRDESFAVQLVDPKAEDKEARANSISHFLGEERDDGTRRNGIVWVPVVTQDDGAMWPRSWAEMLMAEASEFPKGKHDDLVDCFVHGMRFLRQRGLVRRAREVEVEETGLLREAGLGGNQPAPLYPV